MKIPQKRNLIREPSTTCSHIWHVDIPKCVNKLDTICESLVEIQQFKHEW